MTVSLRDALVRRWAIEDEHARIWRERIVAPVWGEFVEAARLAGVLRVDVPPPATQPLEPAR